MESVGTASFAAWGLLFAGFDCSLAWVRRREDPYNSIASGFLTGATLALRSGLRMAAISGTMGALFLTIIEGLSAVLTNKLAAPPMVPEMMPNDPEVLESLPETEPWWKKIFSFSSSTPEPQQQQQQQQQQQHRQESAATDFSSDQWRASSYSDSQRGSQEALRGERVLSDSFDEWSDEDDDEMVA